MMRSLFMFLAITCIYVNAYTSIYPYDPKSNQTSHCYSSITGPMESGEEKRLENECALANCGASRDIQIRGCGVVAVMPPCRKEKGDLRKPYPDCCYEIVCP